MIIHTEQSIKIYIQRFNVAVYFFYSYNCYYNIVKYKFTIFRIILI